ncbi:hypothetical protein [Paenibacillus wynnii]|uniref:hypothetical protein n=1 Tax=Paenibacillus wynnii TaxID=268407 RepID=UPI0027951375|nr:hypothetical protein [Paenibacillus wynnii]MDQ0196313.1 putative Zn finger protein [Paenibacillus wynnii]
MNGSLELQLEAVPGVLKAAQIVLPGSPSELSIKVPLWSPSTRKELVRRLALCPNEMYALLQGRAPHWFNGLEILPANLEQTSDADVEDVGMKNDDMLKQIEKSLSDQPLLALKLRGFPKEELLEAVFAFWAETAADAERTNNGINPTAVLTAELARLERKGPAISSGEWLAEAAAEGSLHQPGTLFHEVGDRPFPKNPVVATVTEDWQNLLPQTPRVQDGLALVMRRVSEAAAGRARGNNKL